MNTVLKKLKPAKSDPIKGIASDFLIHATERLFELDEWFKDYTIHVYVSS